MPGRLGLPRQPAPELRVFPDLESLSRAAADAVADLICSALHHTVRGSAAQRQDRFALALSGGHTPKRLYELLANESGGRVPWSHVHLFWGDERYVPSTDVRSNFGMFRQALLGRVSIPSENVHAMPTDFPDPEDAARAYERGLRDFFGGEWPEFDLVLLGLGPDGHTASLFPGSAALAEKRRCVVPAQSPVEPAQRLTLTLPVLNHAARVHFLAAGADKAGPLRRALADPPDPAACPASAVRPERGEVVWWVDQSAAEIAERRFDPAARG